MAPPTQSVRAMCPRPSSRHSKWCQPGKFGANLRVAWTKAEQVMRKSQPKGPAQNAGTDAALEASCTELNEFYKATEMFVPYYDLPLHKRIVTMDPLPAVDINEATIQKLKKLLECAGPPPPPNNGCHAAPHSPTSPTSPPSGISRITRSFSRHPSSSTSWPLSTRARAT